MQNFITKRFSNNLIFQDFKIGAKILLFVYNIEVAVQIIQNNKCRLLRLPTELRIKHVRVNKI